METTSDIKPCVYYITDGEYVKIGVSNNVMERLFTLQTANPKILRILDVIPTNSPYTLEDELHREYQNRQVNNEWYDILNKFVKKDHILLDPQEVHDFFRLNYSVPFDKIAYHYGMVGTYYEKIKQVTKKEYEKYLRNYLYISKTY